MSSLKQKREKYLVAEKKRKASRGRAQHAKGASRWYEMTAAFDPTLAEAVTLKDSGFMRGMVEDFLVVQVEETMSVEKVQALGEHLNRMGVKALVIKQGVEFLRLRVCSREQEKQLDQVLKTQEQDREAAEKSAGAEAGHDSVR